MYKKSLYDKIACCAEWTHIVKKKNYTLDDWETHDNLMNDLREIFICPSLQKINITNIMNWLWEQENLNLGENILIKPPFNNYWLEGVFTGGDLKGVETGFGITALNEDFIISINEKNNLDAKGGFLSINIMKYLDSNIYPFYYTIYLYNNIGEFLSYRTNTNPSNLLDCFELEKNKETVDAFIRVSHLLPFYTNYILNVKNIDICDAPEPPTGLNKKHERKYGIPLTKYKILTVKKPGKKGISRNFTTEEQNSFHICRGHFKHYTEKAPLFGRYTGTFWIPPHTRGNKEHGEIIKDYKVEIG